MKLVTCNIRYTTFDDGENYQALRRPMIAEKILSERPAVIGFQELNTDSYMAMKGWLPGYDWAGYGTYADFTGESDRICWDASRYELHATDQLWLSPEPRMPGSRYENLRQSSCPRVVTWVKLLDRITLREFYVFNAHLDHVSETAIEQGMMDVLSTVRKVNEDHRLPTFVMGDWNFEPSEKLYRLIQESGFRDVSAGIPVTFQGLFTGLPLSKCDYILTDVEKPYVCTAWTDHTEDDRYLSDHYPLCLEIEL